MFKLDKVQTSITNDHSLNIHETTENVVTAIERYMKTKIEAHKYYRRRSVESTLKGQYGQVYCVEMWKGDVKWLKVGATTNFEGRLKYLRTHGHVRPLLLTNSYCATTTFKLEQATLHSLYGKFVTPPGNFSTECIRYSEANAQLVRGLLEEIFPLVQEDWDLIPHYRDEEDIARIREMEESLGLPPSNVRIGDIHYKSHLDSYLHDLGL